MTHPFHPLAGCEFTFAVRRHTWAEDRVFFFTDDGGLKSLPSAWTDAVPVDPFVVIGEGRSPFRPADLLELSALLTQLRVAVAGREP